MNSATEDRTPAEGLKVPYPNYSGIAMDSQPCALNIILHIGIHSQCIKKQGATTFLTPLRFMSTRAPGRCAPPQKLPHSSAMKCPVLFHSNTQGSRLRVC
ncbi:hypothetical protein EMVG_00214 [Emiliania huxleyi virus PS401]|nr:hypothetical protein EMVG_00214 [Emiliania huxleyi virus PS401]